MLLCLPVCSYCCWWVRKVRSVKKDTSPWYIGLVIILLSSFHHQSKAVQTPHPLVSSTYSHTVERLCKSVCPCVQSYVSASIIIYLHSKSGMKSRHIHTANIIRTKIISWSIVCLPNIFMLLRDLIMCPVMEAKTNDHNTRQETHMISSGLGILWYGLCRKAKGNSFLHIVRFFPSSTGELLFFHSVRPSLLGKSVFVSSLDGLV